MEEQHVPIKPSPGWLLVNTYPVPEATKVGEGKRLWHSQIAESNRIMQAHVLVSQVIEVGPPMRTDAGSFLASQYSIGEHVLHPPYAGVDLSESPHRDMLRVKSKSGLRLIKEEDIQGTPDFVDPPIDDK